MIYSRLLQALKVEALKRGPCNTPFRGHQWPLFHHPSIQPIVRLSVGKKEGRGTGVKLGWFTGRAGEWEGAKAVIFLPQYQNYVNISEIYVDIK